MARERQRTIDGITYQLAQPVAARKGQWQVWERQTMKLKDLKVLADGNYADMLVRYQEEIADMLETQRQERRIDRLVNAHDRYLKKIGAEATNFCQSIDDWDTGAQVSSKTTLGRVNSTMDFESWQVDHELNEW